MRHEVWPDAKVRAAVISRYTPVLIDPDLASSGAVMERYAVGGVPTVLILDASGAVVRQANFLTRDAMLRFLGARGEGAAPLGYNAPREMEGTDRLWTRIFFRACNSD